MFHMMRLRPRGRSLQACIAQLPDAEGGGKVFGEVRPNNRDAFETVSQKIEASVAAGVLKPGSRVVSVKGRGGKEMLQIIVQPVEKI